MDRIGVSFPKRVPGIFNLKKPSVEKTLEQAVVEPALEQEAVEQALEDPTNVRARRARFQAEALVRAASKRRLAGIEAAKEMKEQQKAAHQRGWERCPICWAPKQLILEKTNFGSLTAHQLDCIVSTNLLILFSYSIYFRILESRIRTSSLTAIWERSATANP